MTFNIESELKSLQYDLTKLRTEQNNKQREVYEIDDKIRLIIMRIVDLDNQLPNADGV